MGLLCLLHNPMAAKSHTKRENIILHHAVVTFWNVFYVKQSCKWWTYRYLSAEVLCVPLNVWQNTTLVARKRFRFQLMMNILNLKAVIGCKEWNIWRIRFQLYWRISYYISHNIKYQWYKTRWMIANCISLDHIYIKWSRIAQHIPVILNDRVLYISRSQW